MPEGCSPDELKVRMMIIMVLSKRMSSFLSNALSVHIFPNSSLAQA